MPDRVSKSRQVHRGRVTPRKVREPELHLHTSPGCDDPLHRWEIGALTITSYMMGPPHPGYEMECGCVVTSAVFK